MGHRISSLPIAEYCGQAPRLAATHDFQQRSALMSTWFHQHCAGQPEAAATYARLTEEEREEVLLWQKPKNIEIQGVVLEYEHAQKELAVGLRADMQHTAHSAEDAITSGTLDFAWSLDIIVNDEPIRWAFPIDIKRTRWTSETDTLQLHGYGNAYASLCECQGYTPGLYIADEARFVFGPPVDLYSVEAAVIADRLVHAASNDGPYNPGAHCKGCWSRFHCPNYLMPPELALSSLAPFVEAGKLDPGSALEPLLLAQRAKETAERVISLCKDVASRNGGIHSADGKKVWRQNIVTGRESTISVKALREKLGNKAEELIVRGAPYETYRWVNK